MKSGTGTLSISGLVCNYLKDSFFYGHCEGVFCPKQSLNLDCFVGPRPPRNDNNMFVEIFVVILSSLIFFFQNPSAFAKGQDPAAKIFERQADAIVLIGVEGTEGSRLGSGFFVEEDGLIVTNHHLIENASKIFVKLKNKKVYTNVKLAGSDAKKDIALLRIHGRGFRKVKLGDSGDIAIGQRVITIGNPLGLESTISDGLISALRKDDHGLKLLQISVPLSQGSSGGPLFNLKGEVVGITTASLEEGQNLNFAIPINYVKSLLRKSDHQKRAKRYSKKDFARVKFSRDNTPLAFEEEGSFQSYTIKPHDTLYGLAQRFDTSVEDLMALNKLSDVKIYSGQRIKVPSLRAKIINAGD